MKYKKELNNFVYIAEKYLNDKIFIFSDNKFQ